MGIVTRRADCPLECWTRSGWGRRSSLLTPSPPQAYRFLPESQSPGGNMNRQLIPLLFAGSLLAVQASPADLRYESKTLGLRFQIPPAFVIGQPAELPGTKEMVEEMAKRGMEYDP